MIGRNANKPATSKEFCVEQIGLAVYETLKQYGKISVRQISESELFFITENGKHLQITDEDDQLFLFSLDFNWNKKFKCYILKP
jgi:hypothetical protein